MRYGTCFLCFILLFGQLSVTAHAQAQTLASIPDGLSAEDKAALDQLRSSLIGQKAALSAVIKPHDAKCGNVPDNNPALVQECSSEKQQIVAKVRAYQDAVNQFDVKVTDTKVVDARVLPWGSDLPKVDEIERSPAADRAHKGLVAAANHDWPVALAWWQEALQRDPDNAALKRSIDLAQWMVDSRAKEAESRKVFQPSLDDVRRGDQAALKEDLAHIRKADPHAQLPKDSDMEYLYDVMNINRENDPQARQAELAQLQKAHPDLVVPKDSDMELLFSDSETIPPVVENEALFRQSNNLGQQQNAFNHSVAQDLYDKASLQFMLGDNKGYNEYFRQAMEASRKAKIDTPNSRDSIHN